MGKKFSSNKFLKEKRPIFSPKIGKNRWKIWSEPGYISFVRKLKAVKEFVKSAPEQD
jgi:hypothetical protein